MGAVNVTALLFARQRLWESPARRGEPRRSSSSTKPRRRWGSRRSTICRRRRCARAIRKPSTCGRAVDFRLRSWRSPKP